MSTDNKITAIWSLFPVASVKVQSCCWTLFHFYAKLPWITFACIGDCGLLCKWKQSKQQSFQSEYSWRLIDRQSDESLRMHCLYLANSRRHVSQFKPHPCNNSVDPPTTKLGFWKWT